MALRFASFLWSFCGGRLVLCRRRHFFSVRRCGRISRSERKALAMRKYGQKQRTAIARAIIRNPRILILDDALSSVDTHTEDKILNHLREVMRGRTTIFISHRVSTVRNADMIAVLHSGRIVELGTHDELIARNGYYTDLYNKQLLEEELAEV